MSPSKVVITGAASGMGAALAERLRSRGTPVLGVDRESADIDADLGSRAGRRRCVERVRDLAGASLGGLVTCAGVSGHAGLPGSEVVSVNYFGTVDVMSGLRPLLAAGPSAAAVAISSIGAAVHPDLDLALVDACLAGDEEKARALADAAGPPNAYVAAKLALIRWARLNATTAEWIGAGVTLNTIAPGLVDTPMVANARRSADGRAVVDGFGVPAGRAGRPQEVAALAEFLLGGEARYLVGAVLVIDGGTEAASRPDWRPSS
ncbi:SDR family oxidoreductase [Kitasatospora viridis]|uniref:NAD(P)-dependent dehydrogenase (Short-subunit alcohol dehydrogenase family) n=1 Tax=Kitasatospora viridis TaxID=281105 RepID=A0A561SAG4_9ACTN|nr:SDR family oxidoreductase [Kitasatospora viridis]TWF71861.1 NAD(P)-dependent dehydrogenase (short-subunit alcohol dehydrogenase family) [Kitasatospora viridis]